MTDIAQLPTFERRKEAIMHQIILLSCHATTQLLIYSKALNRHQRSFVQGTLQNHIEIFGRLL